MWSTGIRTIRLRAIINHQTKITMTQRHLSPKEILSYLCDLERKLPKREFKIYTPTHPVDNTEISAEELNAECQKMLVFAGLKNYLADAKFAVLDNSIAGNTIPGDTSGGAIHINVSIDMKRNWRGVLATLAHEICHHVIHYHGIRPNLSWMLETYTDLCTMYIGFGELILQGYRTNMESGTLTLGYLDRNTYEVTNHLVSVVCGGVDSHNTGLAGSDLFADDAIRRGILRLVMFHSSHRLSLPSHRNYTISTFCLIRPSCGRSWSAFSISYPTRQGTPAQTSVPLAAAR